MKVQGLMNCRQIGQLKPLHRVRWWFESIIKIFFLPVNWILCRPGINEKGYTKCSFTVTNWNKSLNCEVKTVFEDRKAWELFKKNVILLSNDHFWSSFLNVYLAFKNCRPKFIGTHYKNLLIWLLDYLEKIVFANFLN